MSSSQLTMAVFGSSEKENEKRMPIHPDHIADIDPALKARIFFEKDYGRHFQVQEDWLASQCGGIMEKKELYERADILLLPKPTAGDFPHFREGQILWGWPHCVQGAEITQTGIDKKMTYIAWEAMNQWRKEGSGMMRWMLHTFHMNNEIAGYASVHHALQLCGISGHFGVKRSAAVIGFGATGRGSVLALQSMGILDVTVFTKRNYTEVQDQMHAVTYRQIQRTPGAGNAVRTTNSAGEPIALADALQAFDVVVNCELQDPQKPSIYIFNHELPKLRPNTLLVDVSCDKGMGFEFAKPTSFENPMFIVGDRVIYYAVDHSPSHFWNSATFEISRALLPYIPAIMAGPTAWEEDPTISHAIEIREGRVQNPKILAYQNREQSYPHAVIG